MGPGRQRSRHPRQPPPLPCGRRPRPGRQSRGGGCGPGPLRGRGGRRRTSKKRRSEPAATDAPGQPAAEAVDKAPARKRRKRGSRGGRGRRKKTTAVEIEFIPGEEDELPELAVLPEEAVLVRGVAEELPFHDETFDRVICQGALDHFVAPETFMAEAARIIRPDGRVIIALTNYESLSCRAGRPLDRFAIDILRRPRPPDRPYYQPPPDHHHKGDLPFVRSLGGASLSLVRCYGLSLLWLLRGRGQLSWGRLLDSAPEPAARLLLRSLDTCAYPLPSQADMIVSVWQRRPA